MDAEEEQLVDYEGDDEEPYEVVENGNSGHFPHVGNGGLILEDGELLESDGGAPGSHRRKCPQMSEDDARRLATEHNVSLETVRATHERGHDMRAESLHWMSLALELSIGPRGPHEQFKDWKENVARGAHARNLPHPWDGNSNFLRRCNRPMRDARCAIDE
jgi:hypothetical protein